jgi:uncharacterized protein
VVIVAREQSDSGYNEGAKARVGGPIVTRDEVLEILSAHLPEIRALGVASLAIFGSFARDEARPDSDVDVLVEFGVRPTYRLYLDLLYLLEGLVGRQVHLVIRGDVKARIRPRIEREAILVA